MRLRERVALTVPPILLRIVLGVTFLWAGAGKFLGESDFTDLEALRSAGVVSSSGRAAPEPTEPGPTEPLPSETETPVEPEPEAGGTARAGSAHVMLASWQEAEAELEPEVVRERNVHHITVLLYRGAHPGFDDATGAQKMGLVPKALGSGRTPALMAWTAGAIELAGGAFLLLGLLTRLSALSIAVVMATAIWLTAIGPAIQSGDTLLGILPNHSLYDGRAWAGPLWQFALFMTALAVAFSGPGAGSLDRFVFGTGSDRGGEPGG